MTSSTQPAQNNATPLVEKSNLVSQTSHGPTFQRVASHLLSQALKTLYPDLDIDPDKAMVASPQWRVVDNRIEPGATLYESLTHALIRQSLDATKTNYIEGEHFLTLEPHAKVAVHLAVSIEEIAGMLNDSASLLYVEFQARQLDFWNEKGKSIARWQELSDSLRQALNVQQVKGWDADECAMARRVSMTPDKAARHALKSDFPTIQACLIDIDIVDQEVTSHLLIGGAIVLKARYRERDLITMYTIERAYESFKSMKELGDSLPERLEEQWTGKPLKWRLYEPDGNVFDHMAWALVSSQLDAIDALKSPVTPTTEIAELGLNAEEQARVKQLAAAIPDWLRNASDSDIQDYARYITSLGKLYLRSENQTVRDDIPSMVRYAQGQMCEAIIADPHAVGAADLALDQLLIRITNSVTVDDLALPDPRSQYTENLAQFAMANEEPYMASLSFKNATPVPVWLTPAFLTTIAARVNIGEAYPALIKQKLIDDPEESRRQETLYIDQLRLLLPLLALEAKVKDECGIDEQGYRFISELLDPSPEPTQPIAIYPLTMTPQHRLISSSDTIANMFIISPRNDKSGACLLYRPMLDRPLMQYPSRQNLLYDLHQPGELRDSVLAWLPDKTLSFEYAQYVFPVGLPSPWLVFNQVIDPSQRADRFGRVVFECEEVTGNVLSTLFKSNAQAIVDLADRQSQSNAERRWSLLKDSSWALFNVASNVLSGAVGSAVWAWQTINEIQQALDARERGDSFIEWHSVADILLTLGIILSHHAMIRRKTAEPRPARPSLETAVKTPSIPIVTLDPSPLVTELSPEHYSSIDVAGSVPRHTPSTLGTYLDTLKVPAPDLKNKELTRLNEEPPHLYQLNYKNYAQVGQRWFIVVVDSGEQVHIVYPNDITRTGPLLIHDKQGQWFVDTRLRLRGGGPTSRIVAMKMAKEHRKHQLDSALQSFKDHEDRHAAELQQLQADTLTADKEAYDRATDVYTQRLEERFNAYKQAIEQLKEWRDLGGTAGYTYDLLRWNTGLQQYLSFWFVIKKYNYLQATSVFTQASGPDAAITRPAYVESIQRATDLSHELVEKLNLSQTALKNLQAAGQSGLAEAIKIRKLLPSFTVLEIKANEIGMAQELCLQEQASPMMVEAREAVGTIIVSAAQAAHQVADLMKAVQADTDPQARIEDFGKVIEIFADADQRLQEMPDTYPSLVKPPQLTDLRNLINEFAQLAHTQLNALLPESQNLIEQRSAASTRPGPSRPTIRVSKSRPRDPDPSYVVKTKEEPLKAILPEIRVQPASTLSDIEIIDVALQQNIEVHRFIDRTRKDALRPRRIPADMQDLFDQYALSLERSATSVDETIARIKAAKGIPPPVASLSLELRQAATSVKKAGISTRAIMYKARKPTQSSFKWMHENGQIGITRNGQGRIQTKQLGDYFQEYRVLDKTNNDREVWVAHFHYETLKSPSDNPTAAHLKVSDAILKTLSTERQQELITLEPLDYEQRKINDPVLRKLFLDLEPAGKS